MKDLVINDVTITAQDLELALALALPQDEQVTVSDVKSKVPKTDSVDGYTSVIRPVQVTYQVQGSADRVEHFMVKCHLSGTLMSTWFEAMAFFQRENEFYHNLLPKLNLHPDPFPKAYPIPRLVSKVVLMEDLKKVGYTMSDAKLGLETDQVKLILEQLARLHAASHKLIQADPEGFERDFPLLCRSNPESKALKMSQHVTRVFNSLMMAAFTTIEDLKETNDVVERFSKFIHQLPDLNTKVKASTTFPVICKADCWSNNFMFKNQDQVKLIDVQVAIKGSPVLDVLDLMCTSTTPELRAVKFEDWIHFYHERLGKELAHQGLDVAKVYPFTDFIKEYHEKFAYGLYCGLINLKAVHADGPEIGNLCANLKDENSLDEAFDTFARESAFDRITTNPVLRERVLALITEAADLGLF